MLSARDRGGVAHVRLHHMFIDADDGVLRSLARFLREGSAAASAQLQRFIRDHGTAIRRRVARGQGARERPPPRPARDLRGGQHAVLRGRSRRAHRLGAHGAIARLGASAARSSSAATAARDTLIRVHPVLDAAWVPRFFVEYIVYHELLHHVLGMPVRNGRRDLHGPEFRARERLFARYDEAIAWEQRQPRSPAVGLNGALSVRSLLRSRAAVELLWLGLACACVFPLFYVRYAPIQDLPQHLAAVRVLHDFHDPALRFARYFEIDLWRTQYLAYLPRGGPARVPHGRRARLQAAHRGIARRHGVCAAQPAAGARKGRPARAARVSARLQRAPRTRLLELPRGDPARAVRPRARVAPARQLLAPARARDRGARVRLLLHARRAVRAARARRGPASACRARCRRWRAPTRRSRLRRSRVLVWLRGEPGGPGDARPRRAASSRGRSRSISPRAKRCATCRAGSPTCCTTAAVCACSTPGPRCSRSRARCGPSKGCWRASRARAPPPSRLYRPRASARPRALARGMALRVALLAPLCAALYFVLPTGYDWIWPIAPRFPLLAALFADARAAALPRWHAPPVRGARDRARPRRAFTSRARRSPPSIAKRSATSTRALAEIPAGAARGRPDLPARLARGRILSVHSLRGVLPGAQRGRGDVQLRRLSAVAVPLSRGQRGRRACRRAGNGCPSACGPRATSASSTTRSCAAGRARSRGATRAS